MASLLYAATSNAFNTTLNGNVGTSDTTITLTSATGLQSPGLLVIDRVNANGTATPLVREYISFTGISTNTLTGVTRGLGGSSAQTHSSGAIVEDCMDVTRWNNVITTLLNAFTSGGVVDATKIVDLTSSQTLTNKILSSPTISGTVPGTTKFTVTQPTFVTATDAATVTFDLSAGNIQRVTLGASRTLAVSNVSNPQVFILMLKQGGSGSNTVSWFSSIVWAQGTTPTLTTTTSKTDIFGFIYDGTNYFGTTIGLNY